MAAIFLPIQKFPVVHTLPLFCFMILQNYPKISPMLLMNFLKIMTKNCTWSSLEILELTISNKRIWEHCMVNNHKFHPSLGEKWLMKKSVYLPLLVIQVHLSSYLLISLLSESFFEVLYVKNCQFWKSQNPVVTYATAKHQGLLFWITCKRLKLLRKAGCLQLIQNLAPSVGGRHQCCIRIISEETCHLHGF